MTYNEFGGTLNPAQPTPGFNPQGATVVVVIDFPLDTQ